MLLYWSNISVWLSTLTNWPLTKYTPFSTWKADPVWAAPFAIVEANGLPIDILVFPKRPEEIIVLHDNSSASKNVAVLLFDVLDPK